MLDAVTVPPAPLNEPVRSYAPGSAERAPLEARLKELAADRIDLPMNIGGEQRMGSGARVAGRPASRARAANAAASTTAAPPGSLLKYT